jgi:3'-5' exoribonuclease
MTRRYVKQLTPGESVNCVFLVVDKQIRVNRQGSSYLHLEVRDRSGTIEARFWNVGEEVARGFDPGDYVIVRGKVQHFQGLNQIIVSGVDPTTSPEIEPSEFLPPAVADADKLVARLREMLRGIKDLHLRALADCFLIDETFFQKFTRAPAGMRNHHAYHGGLLEHVVTMLTAADRIVDLYPAVDRDLLLCGIFLHDVGKVDELTYEQAFGYSDEGQLVGHLVMGVGILREKISRASELLGEPFPDELRLRLEHMIVSHHGSAEFGSPKLPMTPEAIALHYLDNLDAKIHVFAREVDEASNQTTAWTAYNPSLNRRIFKGAAPPPEE